MCHVAQTPPLGGTGYALGDFDGSVYGHEYLNFIKYEEVTFLPAPPTDNPDARWAFGELKKNSRRGYFPPHYVKVSVPDGFRGGDAGTIGSGHGGGAVVSPTLGYGYAIQDFDGSEYGGDYLHTRSTTFVDPFRSLPINIDPSCPSYI